MICRLCVTDLTQEDATPLFCNTEETSLVKIITKFLFLELTEHDTISTSICHECVKHLTDFHKFCQHVDDRQSTLQRDYLMCSFDVKAQSVDEPLIDINEAMDDEEESLLDIKDIIVEPETHIYEPAQDQEEHSSDPTNTDARVKTDNEMDLNSAKNIRKELFSQNFTTLKSLNNEPISKNDLTELRKDIKKELLEMRKDLREHHKEMKSVLRQEGRNKEKERKEFKAKSSLEDFNTLGNRSILPKTPFTDIEDFNKFEKSIGTNKARFSHLIASFYQHIGAGSEKWLKTCWRLLLDDEAAQHLCWKGTIKKTAVRTLNVTAALKKAFDTKFPNSSGAEFEKTCIIFFQHAKNRYEKKRLYIPKMSDIVAESVPPHSH